MSDFDALDEEYDPDTVEAHVADYWESVDAYERTVEHRSDGEAFFFVDGPPYTSGSAHLGTTWNKALKDTYIRYKRMRGYDVTDRPGWDMHGLPIEVKVEEELGFENKKDIEAYGEEAFIERCKEFAERNRETMTEDFQSFGVWMDWADPYETVDPAYMEAAWWGFRQAHDRGLVEEGMRSIDQCPRCETAIANNEVEYHDMAKPSIYVKFPLADREGSLVVWTTTPWTIVANTFVAVDGDLSYVGVDAERDGETERLYVAEAVVEEVLSAGRYDDYEVVEEHTGEEMVGWQYDHPLAEQVPDHPSGEGARQVYTADYVEADRTGLVHSAPGHGEEDFERGQELGLEVFCPVGSDGVYTEAAGEYAGAFVRDANDDVVADLDKAGLLVAHDETTVREGQCWRCDTDIVRVVTDQWFITVTDVKAELLANIEDSEWFPDWARDNRFRDFVEDAPDWNVSRQRYWGIPIPIWECDTAECDHLNVVGTRDDLAERADQTVDPGSVDLHKPTVDGLTMDCAGCGETAERVPDVFDVWLDSSVATWGTLDYPEEPEAFEELWPADLILEAHDQTRGWFWSQLGMGTAALGEVPYEQVLMHGHALDEDGRKMSKSVGNVVEPDEAIERHGADAMRLFLLSQTAQGEDMRFSWDEMGNRGRDLNILWNVFQFPLPYMEMDGVAPADTSVADADLETLDEWVLSRLQTVVATCTEHMEVYEQDKAVNALLEFVVEDVSRYYVQAVRERMWEEADTASKRAAYATLVEVLETVVALLAPFAPYVTEAVHGRLAGEDGHPTVHMRDWPTAAEARRSPELEAEIAVAREVEEAGAHARQRAGRKLRWPVPRVVVDADGEEAAAAARTHADLLAERLNAHEVAVLDAEESWRDLTYSADADMSVLGPAFGDRAGEVMTALNEARVADPTAEAFEGAVSSALGESVDLDPEMFDPVSEPPEDAAGASFEGGTVYVDASLTEDIESEGYAREVIRRVQELRKELDLDIEERIRLDVAVFDERVGALVAEREDLIAEEVRADHFGEVDDEDDDAAELETEIEGVRVRLAISPVPEARP